MWSLAYSQVDCLPILQLAAWLGAPAVTFAALLTSAALAALAGGARRSPAVVAGLLAVAVIAGALRLAGGAPAGERTRVALAVIDQPFAEGPAAAAAALDQYLPLVKRAEGAEVLVLPELVATLSGPDDPALDRLRVAATGSRLAILVGVGLEGPDGARDSAILIGSDGRTRAVYHKQHLIPGIEDHFRAGSAIAMTGGWGLAICKDLDFATPSRDYAAHGVGLVLAPAWDKDADGWLHARMALVRGVEHGFTLARSARQGRLTVSDDHGRVLAEATSDAAGVVLLADAPSWSRTPTARFRSPAARTRRRSRAPARRAEADRPRAGPVLRGTMRKNHEGEGQGASRTMLLTPLESA